LCFAPVIEYKKEKWKNYISFQKIIGNVYKLKENSNLLAFFYFFSVEYLKALINFTLSSFNNTFFGEIYFELFSV